ncbi:MAG: rhomboid family intramembrane serine protease [Gammaproteobacteria bacterium]|nr:MAG: rhomboid family intramembrane serine protease [Gammaproteobacteria bacterium]
MNHTTIIIAVTVIISMLAWQNSTLFNQLIFQPSKVGKGGLYRFITHGFIHADGQHLLFNMFTLYFFGRSVEPFFNQYVSGFGFIVFYIFAIITAIIPTYINNKNRHRYRSLGASGGVSAVLFSYILMAPWSTLLIFFVPMPAIIFAVLYVAYSIYSSKKGDSNINHSAHLWGAAFGIVATIAIEPNIIPHFINALVSPSF